MNINWLSSGWLVRIWAISQRPKSKQRARRLKSAHALRLYRPRD